MGQSPSRPPTRAEEIDNAEAAIEEERRLGKTDRRCLRDGGRLIYEDFGTAYTIRCENGDFQVTVRGI